MLGFHTLIPSFNYASHHNQLFHLCREGRFYLVIKILTAHPRLAHSNDTDGNTPLHFIFAAGMKDVFANIVNSIPAKEATEMANLIKKAKNKKGFSAYDLANQNLHSALLIFFTEFESDIKRFDLFQSYCILNNHALTLDMLCKNPSYEWRQNEHKQHFYHRIFSQGKTELLRQWWANKPKKDIEAILISIHQTPDINGNTALDLAQKHNHHELLDYIDTCEHTELVQFFSYVEARSWDNAAKMIEESPELINRSFKNYKSIFLHIAQHHGSHDLECILDNLSKENSINAINSIIKHKDSDGNTALHIAATLNKIDFLEKVLRRSLTPYNPACWGVLQHVHNVDIAEYNNQGENILFILSRHYDRATSYDASQRLIKLLINLQLRGYSIKSVNNKNQSLMHIAIELHNISLVRFWIIQGHTFDFTDSLGNNMLHYAIEHCSINFVHELRKLNISDEFNVLWRKPNYAGQTPEAILNRQLLPQGERMVTSGNAIIYTALYQQQPAKANPLYQQSSRVNQHLATSPRYGQPKN